MSTEAILLRIFWMVDAQMAAVKKRSAAQLYPSDMVTIGLLFALTGGKDRPFSRWFAANLGVWFPNVPELSR